MGQRAIPGHREGIRCATATTFRQIPPAGSRNPLPGRSRSGRSRRNGQAPPGRLLRKGVTGVGGKRTSTACLAQAGASIEQADGRRLPFGQPSRLLRSVLLAEGGEHFLDHHRSIEAGDPFHRAAACVAGLDVDSEPALQVLRPRLMAARRSAGVFSSLSLSEGRLFPLPRLAGVTRARCLLFGANTPCKRVRLTPGWGTGAARRAMKSRGSKRLGGMPSR